jgi:hypothetical protein
MNKTSGIIKKESNGPNDNQKYGYIIGAIFHSIVLKYPVSFETGMCLITTTKVRL